MTTKITKTTPSGRLKSRAVAAADPDPLIPLRMSEILSVWAHGARTWKRIAILVGGVGVALVVGAAVLAYCYAADSCERRRHGVTTLDGWGSGESGEVQIGPEPVR